MVESGKKRQAARLSYLRSIFEFNNNVKIPASKPTAVTASVSQIEMNPKTMAITTRTTIRRISMAGDSFCSNPGGSILTGIYPVPQLTHFKPRYTCNSVPKLDVPHFGHGCD